MLYVTTRSNRDAFTAHRTLCTDYAPDNGCFIPMHFPKFSREEIRSFVSLTFEETIAHILNRYFSTKLTKWDVELSVGRNLARLAETQPRIIFAEIWHNPENTFSYVTNGLFRKIYGSETTQAPSEWFSIVVKVALLFGIYGELCRNSLIAFGETIDLSLPADDFSYPIAALYASSAGLPLGTIICNCAKSHELWNLIHRGTLNMGSVPRRMQAGIERFLTLRLGKNFSEAKLYEATPEEKESIQEGLFCVVSGLERILQSINGVYSNTSRIITPGAALCISGLGDYRAKNGECKYTLIFEEGSPALFTEQIERATGLTKKKLENRLRE